MENRLLKNVPCGNYVIKSSEEKVSYFKMQKIQLYEDGSRKNAQSNCIDQSN